MNLEWAKKHPVATGAAVLAALVVIYLIFRSSGSSSGGGLASLAAQQQQGQLQLDQLNAEQTAQSNQTNAQLAATEYQTQAAEAQNQNQLVGSLASTIIPAQLQSQLYSQELGYQNQQEQAILGAAEPLLTNITTAGTGTRGSEEIALAELLNEPQIAQSYLSGLGQAAVVKASQPSALNSFLGGLGKAIGAGLFGLGGVSGGTLGTLGTQQL